MVMDSSQVGMNNVFIDSISFPILISQVKKL